VKEVYGTLSKESCLTHVISACHVQIFHPLQEHYGQKDPAAVAKVKEVYGQLGLAAQFEAYEAKSF
jgi:hypothetical protein